ncbi:MAG: hypothetical protein AABY10_06190 [Nanoarchaeota archaeon]
MKIKRLNFKKPTAKLKFSLFLIACIFLTLGILRFHNFPNSPFPLVGSTINHDDEKNKEIIAENNNQLTPKMKSPSKINTDISSLSSSNILKDLPEKASIKLLIGNKAFTIKKSSLVSGSPSDPDITVNLPEKYAVSLISNPCQAAKSANSNGDLKVTIHKSKASLLLKYRSMLKYRSCL